MTKWTDVTNYRQGQRGKIEPTCWECAVAGLKIWISCGHLYFPDDWVMNARPLGVVEKPIGPISALSLDDVKSAALRMAWDAARLRVSFVQDQAEAMCAESESMTFAKLCQRCQTAPPEAAT